MLWFTFLSTGPRVGELLGLRWRDVDLGRGLLRVVRKLVELRGRLYFEVVAKTAAGQRPVALDEATVAILGVHRDRQQALRQQLGGAWGDQDLVFCNQAGGPLYPCNVARRFTALVRRSGLPKLSPHGMRHTHATLLLGEDVHPKLVSERLGHASIGITLNTYSHVLPGMHRKAADAIGRALAPRPCTRPAADEGED